MRKAGDKYRPKNKSGSLARNSLTVLQYYLAKASNIQHYYYLAV